MVLALPYEVFDTPYAENETPLCNKVLCYSDEGIFALPFLYSHLEALCFRDDHGMLAQLPASGLTSSQTQMDNISSCVFPPAPEVGILHWAVSSKAELFVDVVL